MAEKTTKGEAGHYQRPRVAWLVLALLAILTYFFGLWLPFFGPDEPRYAQVAREMFERGDWITPTLGGFNWFEKPALLYWLEIAAFHVFGVSEFSARLGPALFGLGTIAALWLLGRYSGLSTSDDRSTTVDFANWLALISASTLGIIVFAHGASFDIVVTFPITAAMVSYFIFDRTKKNLPLVSFYFFIGLAVLAKGLIGIVFPFAIVAFYHVLRWRMPSGRFLVSLAWGTLLSVAVASTWYLPMYIRHGWPFIDEFFIQHHFQRFTSNKYQHPQPFFFYLWVLPLMTLPWLPFFFAAIYQSVKSAIRRTRAGNELSVPLTASAPHLLSFSAAWLLVPLVFFSFSGSKLPGYILPSVPPAMVITAVFLFGKVRKSSRWAAAVMSTAAATLVLCIVLFVVAVPRFADLDSVAGLMKAADDLGYSNVPVYGLHTIVHSAEYYAAGRLLRDPQGKQKKLYSPAEVAAEMRRAGTNKALVLVPPEYLGQLTASPILLSEIIRENGEWVIVGVEHAPK